MKSLVEALIGESSFVGRRGVVLFCYVIRLESIDEREWRKLDLERFLTLLVHAAFPIVYRDVT